jgi:hypothetical protein
MLFNDEDIHKDLQFTDMLGFMGIYQHVSVGSSYITVVLHLGKYGIS